MAAPKSKRGTQRVARLHADLQHAALYVRVSTGKQRDNWSVKDQLGLAKLGEERGLPVVVYDEQGVSGETIEDRPTMQRLLADVEAGKVAAVIAVDWNRLSRDEDLLDGLRIKKACKDSGTLVLTPGRVYDFSTETDGFLAQLEMMFAASQKQKNVKALTRGSYQKFRSCGWAGGVPPYGYRTVRAALPNDKWDVTLEVDSDEAAVVRRVFTLYADGHTPEGGAWTPMSDAAIARLLNGEGLGYRVRSSSGNKRGARFQTGQLRPFERFDIIRMLRQRAYLGLWERGVSQLSKWVRDDGPAEVHLPDLQIVDVATWQRAQAVREQRAQGPRRSACTTYALAGVIRCAICGGAMRGCQTDSTGKYPIYQCDTRHRFGRDLCAGTTISGRIAKEAVDALLVEQLERLPLRRYLDLAAQDEAARTEGEIAQDVLVELQQTDDAIQRLVMAVAQGAFTPAEARNVKLELMEKKQRLEARLARLRERAQVKDELREVVTYVSGNLPALVRSLDGARYRHLARLVFASVQVEAEGFTRARVAHVRHFALSDTFADILASFESVGTPAARPGTARRGAPG
jgi:DNA invertase Pin-like site-specific DNA recombinase